MIEAKYCAEPEEAIPAPQARSIFSVPLNFKEVLGYSLMMTS